MKITKRRLKEIIKEELNGLGAPGLGKDVRFTTAPLAWEIFSRTKSSPVVHPKSK